jgi:phosphatidylinositol-3-phosphatase
MSLLGIHSERARRRCTALLGSLLAALALAGCGGAAAAPGAPQATPTASAPASTSTFPAPSAPVTTASSPSTSSTPSAQPVTKVLTIVEENHSLDEMRSGMPYLYGLATRFGYADHYTAIRHPSLPNYLAIAGGDTFGVTDDADPAAHVLGGPTIFSEAQAHGRTAGVYAESMTTPCALTTDERTRYAVRHNAWAYFADERAACTRGEQGSGFVRAAQADALPDVAQLIPNTCHDAHDGDQGCTLADADEWLRSRLSAVLASGDFTSGRLAVVVTADEDDHSSGNTVLTVVLQAGLDGSGTVVSTPLTHYSLSRFCSQVAGGPPLRQAASAPDLAEAFRLTV